MNSQRIVVLSGLCLTLYQVSSGISVRLGVVEMANLPRPKQERVRKKVVSHLMRANKVSSTGNLKKALSETKIAHKILKL